MLEIQKYLRAGGTPESLKETLGITNNRKESRVIFNYDQIESPKTHPIVQECRGLVLEDKTWNIVAKSFNRFFNWGEVADEMSEFNFADFSTMEKVDGSLLLLYHYNGEWHTNTRNSYSEGEVGWTGKTWRQIFEEAFDVNNLQHLDKTVTYVCELCSRYNKVVRDYPNPTLFLLTCFRGETEIERVNKEYFSLPLEFKFSSVDDIKSYLDTLCKDDPTFEGVVIRDNENRRWKLKSSTYWSLHKLKGNDNLFHPKYLLPWILKGEAAEIHLYFPECDIYKYDDWVWSEYDKLEKKWLEVKDIESQKEFALAIQDEQFKSVLFQVRRSNQPLREQFINSEGLILKIIKEKIWD